MGFELKKESYSGSIKAISIGKGDSAITVGGETCYPFYTFEGDMPNKPVIAMEIWDMEPEDWPAPVLAPFKDVLSDPAAWAKKCVDDFGADAIVVQLKSTDPNDKDASPESEAETVKKVLAAVKVPVMVWGCANPTKDEAVLKVVAEQCQGANLVLGPVEEKNYKGPQRRSRPGLAATAATGCCTNARGVTKRSTRHAGSDLLRLQCVACSRQKTVAVSVSQERARA